MASQPRAVGPILTTGSGWPTFRVARSSLHSPPLDRNGLMITLPNTKPQSLVRDRQDSSEPKSVISSYSSQCHDWVAEETSTRITFVQRTRHVADGAPACSPRVARASAPLAAGHRL